MEQSGVFFSHVLMVWEPSFALYTVPCVHRRSPSCTVAPLPFCKTAYVLFCTVIGVWNFTVGFLPGSPVAVTPAI